MKITDIKQQVKNQSRFSIFVDDKYKFSLSQSAILDTGIKIGKEITQAELDNLVDESISDKAYNSAISLIVRRNRSEWEMKDYLKRKDLDPDLIDDIVEKLKTYNLLDDRDFAKAWVENRRLLKSTSKRRLQQELKAKRVSDEIIKSVLGDDDTDEKEVIKYLIERKIKQTRYQDPQKLMAYLIRQGYEYGDIKDVIKDLNQ